MLQVSLYIKDIKSHKFKGTHITYRRLGISPSPQTRPYPFLRSSKAAVITSFVQNVLEHEISESEAIQHRYCDESYDEQSDIMFPSKTKTQLQTKWKAYQTIFNIIIGIFLNYIDKSLYVFYSYYATNFGLNLIQFSYIIISIKIGYIIGICFIPIMILARNLEISNHTSNYMTITSFCGGLLGLIFILPPFLGFNTSQTLIYCCFNRILFGLCTSIFNVFTIDSAIKSGIGVGSRYTNKVITYLNLSWTLSTLLYVLVGYLIKYTNWWLSFVIFSIITCMLSTCSYLNADPNPNPDNSGYNLNTNKRLTTILLSTDNGINTVIYLLYLDIKSILISFKCMLILIGTLLMSITNGTFQVIISGLWMQDLFNFDESQLGSMSFIIFLGEFIGVILTSMLMQEYGFYLISNVSLFITFVCGLIVILLTYYIDIGGEHIAFILIFLLYYGWQSFFVLTQILSVKYSPNHNISSMLLLNIIFASIGKIIGNYIAPIMYNQSTDGLIQISVVWICCSASTAVLYWILKNLTNKTCCD